MTIDDDEEEGFLEGVDDVLHEPSPPPPPASRSRPCRPPARPLRRLCQPRLLTSGLLRLSRLRWLVLRADVVAGPAPVLAEPADVTFDSGL